MLSSQEAITLLVAANGSASLAAARARQELGMDHVTEPLLLSAIAADPNSTAILMRQMTLLLVLQSFDTLRKTNMVYLEKLAQMSPDGVAKAYVQLQRNFAALGSLQGPPPIDDPLRQLLAMLPPQVAEAVEQLASGPEGTAEGGEPTMSALLNPLSPDNEATPDASCERPAA